MYYIKHFQFELINIIIVLNNFSGDEANGEPSTSRAADHDETDFSMASLAKRQVTQVYMYKVVIVVECLMFLLWKTGL